MDNLFKHLLEKFEPLDFKIFFSKNEFCLSNRFYCFKIKKINNKYYLSRFWKRGILCLIFKKQQNNMFKIYDDIKDYSKVNNLTVEELNYHSNFSI